MEQFHFERPVSPPAPDQTPQEPIDENSHSSIEKELEEKFPKTIRVELASQQHYEPGTYCIAHKEWANANGFVYHLRSYRDCAYSENYEKVRVLVGNEKANDNKVVRQDKDSTINGFDTEEHLFQFVNQCPEIQELAQQLGGEVVPDSESHHAFTISIRKEEEL